MPESMKIVGATGLGGLWAWHICETNLRCVQGYGIFNLKSQFSIFGSFRDIRVHICDILKFVGVKGGVVFAGMFWDREQHILKPLCQNL